MRHPATPHQEERMDHVERCIAEAAIVRDRAQAKIDRLMAIPDEPTTADPDGALTIWFKRSFRPGSPQYTYAAVRAGDGKWYVTGGRAPQGYTWLGLVAWMQESKTPVTIWKATEYTEELVVEP